MSESSNPSKQVQTSARTISAENQAMIAGAPVAVVPAGTETAVGGETHQIAGDSHPPMTNQRGTVIADDENSLKANAADPFSLRTSSL